MENTPMDIKLSLSRRIFDQNKKKIQILNHLCRHDGMGKKPTHASVPLINIAKNMPFILQDKDNFFFRYFEGISSVQSAWLRR